MADHGTRKTTTDRLEEAIVRLSNSHTSINDRYNDLASKVDSILEHLRLRDSSPPPAAVPKTPEDERVTIASLYLDGAALSWYQWMFSNGLITSWEGFLQALESRFTPTFYEDPKGALFKLTQHGTVNEYLTQFERLANRVVGLHSPPLFLYAFLFFT